MKKYMVIKRRTTPEGWISGSIVERRLTADGAAEKLANLTAQGEKWTDAPQWAANLPLYFIQPDPDNEPDPGDYGDENRNNLFGLVMESY